jgi:hypothetical protein
MWCSTFKWWLYTTNSDNAQLRLFTAKRQIGVTRAHLGYKISLMRLITTPTAWEKPQHNLQMHLLQKIIILLAFGF